MDLDDLEDVPPPPQVPANASSRRPKAAAGKDRKGKFYGPCVVCGLVKADMPTNSRFCWDHKNANDGFVSNCKADDKAAGNTERMDKYNKMKDEGFKEGPPSELASTLLEYEEKFPAKGRGVKRGHCDTMQLMEKHEVRTAVRSQAKLVKMHKERWLKVATKDLLIPQHEAEAKWNIAEANTPDELTDKLGPGGSLRLPMNTEDSITLSNEVAFIKEANLESKKRKVTKAEDFEKDSMFDSVGGQLSSVMSKLGSSMVSTSGLGVFSGTSATAGFSKPTSQDGTNSSPEKPKPGAAGKAWDSHTQSVKLQSEIEEKIESFQSKATKTLEASVQAIERTLHRSSGNDAVRNQHKYIGILQSKMDVLNMVQWHGASDTIMIFKPDNLKKLAVEAAGVFSPCLELVKNISYATDVVPEEAWIAKFIKATKAAVKFDEKCNMFADRFVFQTFGWQAETGTYLEGSFGRDRCNGLVEELQGVLQRWEFAGSLHNDQKFLCLCRCEEWASSCMTDFSGENFGEKKTKLLEELAKACSEVENFKVDASAVLSIIGYGADGQTVTGELTKFKLLRLAAGLGMLRSRHACKRILSYALELKVAQGKPLPVPVEDELPMLFDLEVMNGLAGVAETEDDNKRLRAALKVRCETMDKLMKSVGTSHTEVLNNVQASDRRAQNEKAKAERLAKAEEEKKKRKAAVDAAKKKGSPDAAVAATTSQFPLMDLEHDGIKPWLEFASPKALQDEFSAKKIDLTVPFVLHKSETIDAAVDDRPVKAAVSIFKIQYPSSSQAKTEGKGQTPYQGTSKDKLKEALCELVPAPYHVTWDAKEGENNVAAKSVDAVSVAGFSPGNVYQGLEKQSLATIRHVIAGRRQVMIFNYMHLFVYAKEKKIEAVQGKKHEDFVKQVVESLSADGAMDMFYKLGGMVHRATFKAGDTYFVPQCSWMLERTVGDAACFGIRTSVLLRTPSCGYEKFREDYEKIHGEDNVVKFWQKLSSLLPARKE
ncbi:unnamed protein product [Symbiodinium sp. CCMP2456]|nr:unnamed protein product [Symbiodinium sp. CCMP2456]